MIGLSSYAFTWRSSERSPRRIDLFAMIEETADLGAGVLQVCDEPAIEFMEDEDLARLLDHAASREVRLELGTRGISPPHLMRYLDLAQRLESLFVRSMLHVPELRSGNEEAIELLKPTTAAFAARGVTLGLETYEQVATSDLVAIVDAVDSPFLGVCLDPANTVAGLEMPDQVIAACAPHVVNVHVKDFMFIRREGWVGFSLVGCALGTGLLPFDEMMAAVAPRQPGVNLIVEHWVPPAGNIEETLRIEEEWTRHSVEFIRARSN